MPTIAQTLAKELGKSEEHVQNVITLLDEGNTVPFIARYRKEMHGTMDDQTIRTLADRLQYLRNLEARKAEVKNSIETQGKLTEELAAAIDNAVTLAEVEDLYRPYKQKRRTRATIAKEKGLEPLAELLFKQESTCPVPEEEAIKYVDPEKKVETVEAALAGASDIIAEWISDDAEVRKHLRALFVQCADVVSCAAKKNPGDSVYRNYYTFVSPVCKVQGHQVLAFNRGEREEVLKVGIDMNRDAALNVVKRYTVKRPKGNATAFVESAAEDAYDRLIFPSVEREIRSMLTDSACEGAIGQFALNLKPLLMQPPVKGFVTMGLDPGYRMGCKVAVVDGTGKVLDTTVVYPTFGDRKKQECIEILTRLIKRHKVQHIAIGNGTASRETEQMTVELIGGLGHGSGVSYAIVNEAGASVYSASPLAAKEFPDFDVNLRSAVSIARRLQDPLAELVKIDPKSIGVGQYQHDMPEKRLSETLGGVVEDCVNAVGVDVNTASAPLLARVSGLNAGVASNIVKYREENGAFTSRRQIIKVPKLGEKAFEQCAGFLRVPESKNVLDNTAVHPESYEAAKKLLDLCGYTEKDVRAGNLTELRARMKAYGEAKLAKECGVGVPTLNDVATELMKPGRDPRDELPAPVLRTDVLEIKDLKPGMELKGTVRNVIDFGAFVDIGVHQDGLVHISQIADRYIRHPSEVVAVGDIVTVWVLEVDERKNRISLTMRKDKVKKNA
ncbi:MAG: RNA-binding transcriptional accessory protein [Clostridia bacterium]|nr:RNA-binding transcriptional accessory protein [Clostridia bacterium]